MERHRKLHGRRMDAEQRDRKREAREVHKTAAFAQKVHGIRAKLFNQKRFKEKAAMRKTIAEHNERGNKHANDDAVADGAVPAYLLDREGVSRAKVLSNTVKQKRKEKAGKWDVPIPKVRERVIVWLRGVKFCGCAASERGGRHLLFSAFPFFLSTSFLLPLLSLNV